MNEITSSSAYLSWRQNLAFALIYFATINAFFYWGYWWTYPFDFELLGLLALCAFTFIPALPVLAICLLVLNAIPIKWVPVPAFVGSFICAALGGAAGYYIGCLASI